MTITFALICAGCGFAIAGGVAFILQRMQPSVLALEVEQSIRTEPSRWKLKNYTFERDDGLAIWIGNGLFHANVYRPRELKMEPADKKLLWNAYNSASDNLTLADLMASKS